MSSKFSKRKRTRNLKYNINRNFKYEQNGNSKIEIPSNVSSNINLKKVAELAKLRELRGDNLDKFDIEEMAERKRKKNYRKHKNVLETRLRAEKGEYVLLDGSEYVGYYHIHDDGTIMTEATHRMRRSQPLITRTDWMENKETFLIISENLDYKNPYKKAKFDKRRNANIKQKITKQMSGRTGGGTGGSGGSGGSGGGY